MDDTLTDDDEEAMGFCVAAGIRLVFLSWHDLGFGFWEIRFLEAIWVVGCKGRESTGHGPD
jgi:hypothetical protein